MSKAKEEEGLVHRTSEPGEAVLGQAAPGMGSPSFRTKTRGEALLDFIYDEVDQRLNPNGDECWYCGGEGFTYDCIDGCCQDAESGCEDCEKPCIECKINAAARAKAIREEVIKTNDIEVAAAWLKNIGRWRDDITESQIRMQLEDAKAALVSGRAAAEVAPERK